MAARFASGYEAFDFVPAEIRRSLAMTAAVTALGTRLFARFGEGRGADKHILNQVKKDADAISAYVMSEALWHFSRKLPENHAIMVCLGEGLMPKAGETPEMGANPLLGFGRVYARPEVAKFIDSRVHRLLNDPGYGWDGFYRKMRDKGITIWGAAIDTLENTSRFAKGEEIGPMTVIHLFDQPLTVARPYEAYMGSLTLPRQVAETARDHSIHLDLLSPRRKLVEAIELAVPGIRRENIHVWTLGGKSRETRLSALWAEWKALGVHLVEDGWRCPSGLPAFNESGTYAPTYLVGTWHDEAGAPHLFLCDGYAASAEALQAASLSQALDVDVTMALFSPRFERPMKDEQRLMRLDPEAPGFVEELGRLLGEATLPPERVAYYRECLREKTTANLPESDRVIRADDFFPEKNWRVLAASGYIGADPYTGLPGVTRLSEDTYAVTTQIATRGAGLVARFVFRFLAPLEDMRLIFTPSARALHRGRGLPAPPGQGLRLGAHPQRIADTVLAGPRVSRRHDPDPLRAYRAGRDASGQADGRARSAHLVQAEPSRLVLVARDRLSLSSQAKASSASRARIVAIRTSAPWAISLQRDRSRGECEMPSTLGTKIMPMGPSVAMACASWPAPLGSRIDLRPRRAAAFSIMAWMAGVARAPSCRLVNMTSTSVPVAFAISAQRSLSDAPRRATFAPSRSRNSTVSSTSPGITLGAFGFTVIWPTVPTCAPGSLFAIS